MNTKVIRLVLIMVFGAMALTAYAEDSCGKKKSHTQVMKFEKGEVFIINELGSIVVANGEEIIVQMAGPKEGRGKKYQNVDLRENDQIFMLNGKSIKNIQDLEQNYTAINESEDVEFGIKRDGKMMIVGFPKAGKDDLPKMQVMMMSADDMDLGELDINGDNVNIQYVDSDDSEGLIPVIEAGLIISESDNQVIVKMLLPNGADMMKDNKLQENDIIASLQGEKIRSSDQFSKLFLKIEDGSNVNMKIVRDGESKTLSYEKKPISGNINVNIQN